RVLPDALAAAVWLIMAASIGWGLFRRGRIRRDAFLGAYVRADGRLRRLLRGHLSIPVRAALGGAGLALVLVVSLVRIDDRASFVVLAAGAPALVLAFAVATRGLSAQIARNYLPVAAWRVAVAAVGGTMVAVLVALSFHASYPDLADVDLERAVWHFVDSERARGATVQILLQLAAAGDGLRLWLAQQLMPAPGDSIAEALGCLAVLAEEAVFVWAYLAYLSPAVLGGLRDGSDRGA
ncbi:MAG: hypothetical protein LOD94_06515, partial [Gammaproteobacteria bacterium]